MFSKMNIQGRQCGNKLWWSVPVTSLGIIYIDSFLNENKWNNVCPSRAIIYLRYYIKWLSLQKVWIEMHAKSITDPLKEEDWCLYNGWLQCALISPCSDRHHDPQASGADSRTSRDLVYKPLSRENSLGSISGANW